MKLFKLSVLIFILSITIGYSQNENREFVNFSEDNSQITITTNDGFYVIKPYSNKIIETSFVPNGEDLKPNSHAVVLKPEIVNFKIIKKENSIYLKTAGIEVEITKSPFQIAYSYKEKPLVSER